MEEKKIKWYMDSKELKRLVYQDEDNKRKLLEEYGACVRITNIEDATDGEGVNIGLSAEFNPDEYGHWRSMLWFTHYEAKNTNDTVVVENIYAVAAKQVEDMIEYERLS